MTHPVRVFPVTLSEEHRAALRELAAHLAVAPPESFDMRDYARSDTEVRLLPAQAECGTVCCALGHGPGAGIPARPGEGWSSYCARAFGIDPVYSHEDWPRLAWRWCFDGLWDPVDNTAPGASARILWMLEHGVPAGRDIHRMQRGELPLCYRPDAELRS